MKRIKSLITRKIQNYNLFVHRGCAVLCPRRYCGYVYRKTTNKSLNLKDPKNFNEKIEWLKVYADLSEWTRLADKYEVRKYIEECGLKHILVRLYGVWDRAEDIDFSSLPDKFVLKTNHGYSNIIIVQDKGNVDVEFIRRQLNKWTGVRYGLLSFEPHYWNIRRRIIAEEYLEEQAYSSFSSSLIDYKFFCVYGKPEVILVTYNRQNMQVGKEVIEGRRSLKVMLFDLDWNPMPQKISEEVVKGQHDLVPKPANLDEMIKVAKILSKPFPQVRVDLYEVNRRIYFGEMTFTPGSSHEFFTTEYNLELGEKLDLSKVKRRERRFII